MRVLHLPLEVAGQIREICSQLTASGVTAVGYNWRNSYFGYDDVVIRTDAYEMANALELAISYFDVFHYHTGYTIFRDKSDIRMALEAGKKVIMHHRGNDVRIPSKARESTGYRNPYVYTGDSQPEAQILGNLAFFSKLLPAAIVQDYELYDFVADYYEKVHVLPRLIDSGSIRPQYEQVHKKVPLVVHAPTSRKFKGTEQILATVTSLRKELPFEFECIELSTKKETMERFRAADIVIDQILCGAYGNVSVEAMALGKPVICYIRPDIQARIPAELPIVSANPDTLYESLMFLIKNPEYRQQAGRQGRAYVEKYHDSAAVIKQLIQIYRSL